MFIVLLKFTDKKPQAAQFMDGHNAWLKRGFEDDVFVLAGGLQPNAGGGIIAHNTSSDALQARVDADPFVAEQIVSAEIIELIPGKTDDRLAFLRS